MACLAVAAIFMAIRGERTSRGEAVAWIVISFTLFGFELCAIRIERAQHELEQIGLQNREEVTRRAQSRSFSELLTRGDALLQGLREEHALTASNLEHITGGSGYCWLVPGEQHGNIWQLGIKNSGTVVLPTCDVTFAPFPTAQELKEGAPARSWLIYHFTNVPVMSRQTYTTTSYLITGDRTYSGKIVTPTQSFIEVIKFNPDPHDPSRVIPDCFVANLRGKALEKECYPQSAARPPALH